MSAYADTDELKNSLSIPTTDTFADADLERCNFAASDLIDGATGRTFGRGAEDDETRQFASYVAARSGYLRVDDLISIDTLRVDPTGRGDWETWTEGSDFRLEPLNPKAGWPYTAVRTLDGIFPADALAVVEIAGRWGWAAPPQPIIEATGLLAKQLFIRDRQNPWGFVTAGEGAVAYISRTDPHINSLIQPYMRRQPAGDLQLT